MKAKEYFQNDVDVINYLTNNGINNDNDFKLKDVLQIIKENPHRLDLLSKYMKFKEKYNIIPNSSNDNISLFDDIDFENNYEKETIFLNKTHKSIWYLLNKVCFKKYTYKKIIRKCVLDIYNGNNIENLKLIVNKFNITDNPLFNYIYQSNIGTIKYEIKVLYEDFISKINEDNERLYINPFLSDKYKTYLFTKNIHRVGDLKKYLNKDIYNNEYNELIRIYPLLDNLNIRVCDYTIDKYINRYVKLSDITNFQMIIKNENINNIIKLNRTNYYNLKKSYFNALDIYINFFDSYIGIYLINYLLSLHDGYFTDIDLSNYFPKNKVIIKYLINKNILYNINYNKEYNIYTHNVFNDNIIINKYDKYIEVDEYNNLLKELYNHLLNQGIETSKEIIINRINKEYTAYNNYYAKGYVSTEYKVYNLYINKYYEGINDISLFIKDYEEVNGKIDDLNKFKYVYLKICKDKYYIKDKYLKKFCNKTIINKPQESTDTLSIYSICESFKNRFTINDIVKEAKQEKKIIKDLLKQSSMYYQLKYNTFIKSDALYVNRDMIVFFKSIITNTKEIIYEKVKNKYNDFLEFYKIKNPIYLYRIIKKIIK